MSEPLSRTALATRLAQDVEDGWVVNLGIGLPTMVADHLPEGREILLHTENGLLGMGPSPAPDRVDGDLINAGKQPVTALPGASYFHTADSFGMMRGGHLDLCVLGAFQVSATGDLANWSTGGADSIPAVGGAMDLARGAREVWVLTDLLARDGTPKVVGHCSYPLTGVGCATRIYTDRAIFEVTPDGLVATELFGTTLEELENLLQLPLKGASL
ncbi:MAG TPA: 3-oxoacid CoA-transferase subunit B [Pseudolysinimonas sp.]|nr:3-oxoacid CoA-transferase subunit B [Pseudolysinimonas sp.]